MAEYAAPNSKKQFEENFAQLKPLMNDTQAYYESSRCLFCFDAPCITACPTGIDIPLFIRQINSGNSSGAAETIYNSNWFGYACGKVCPTEVLCEGACVYNHQDVKPIEIGRLQSYATGSVIRSDKALFCTPPPNGKKVAVIGAGPAGISAACELRLLGFEVEIFEAKTLPSGLTVYGVAPYKITNEEALAEMAWLEKQFGYKIHYNKPVNDQSMLRKLEADFDFIFIGIGLGNTSSIKIPGEEKENVMGAVEFIAALRTEQHKIKIPEKVVVIGGGNTAMDAASESARMGASEVTLAYRRSKSEMGAYEFEYELAKHVGVKGMFNAVPVSIEGNGKASSVKFIRSVSKNGKLETLPGSEFELGCDLVIKATGQSKQLSMFSLIDGLELDGRGRVIVNEHFQTSNPRYFAAGDAVNGGAEVVNAAAEAKVAANAIYRAIKNS